MTIRNPLEWGADQIRLTSAAMRQANLATDAARPAAPPMVNRIVPADIRDVLVKGFGDFGANRTDVLFLCVLYPVVGLLLARAASGLDLLPLVFPLASGFALIGPLAGVGLYEMSRRREQGLDVSWATPFGVMNSPSFGSIVMLGLLLAAIYALWLMAAAAIYMLTLGPQPPQSIGSFVRDVLTTPAGWLMTVVGMGVGFLFALVVLAISAVSFPLLLDREVGIEAAIYTSLRAMATNPIPMLLWGFVVAAGLVLGSIPLFFGLIIAFPVLGHATWHLYRKLVPG